jgi:hypothetical protein
VDYNPKTKILYLVDSQEKVVKRSYIPGSSGHKEAMIGSSQVIVTMTSKASTPLDVATDWLSGNIYWTEAKPGTFGNQKGSIFYLNNFFTAQTISERLFERKKIKPRSTSDFWNYECNHFCYEKHCSEKTLTCKNI